jgi:hypothetical protein
LILPLFSASWVPLSGLSKNPNPSTTIQKVQNLSVDLWGLSWTIVAMSGSESIGLTGSGHINTTTDGITRYKNSQCYSGNTWDQKIGRASCRERVW